MQKSWRYEAARNLIIISAFGVVGLSVGHFLPGIVIGLTTSLLTLYQQLYRFDRWISNKPLIEPVDDESGLIGDLYYQGMYINKKHNDQIMHLESIIKRYEESTRAYPDAVIILSQRNEVEWLNAAAKKLMGLKRKKDIGQSITNLIRYPGFNEYLVSGDYKRSIEFPSTLNKDVWVDARIIPYGQEYRLLVMRDITQIHNLEVMRQDFIANTSHELRTPLTVITGYLEALQNLEDSDISEIIEAMQDQSKRMESIIGDMLLLAKLDSMHGLFETSSRPVIISDLIDSVVEEAKAVSGLKHSFDVNIDRQIDIKGMGSELRSAFSNLILNAVRYTPQGGRISIHWFRHKSGNVRFIVEDNGPGIEATHLPRLTERFYRVNADRSRKTGSTGLGLAIVEQIIRRHQGRLLIESKLGKGSKFTCEFPAELILVAS